MHTTMDAQPSFSASTTTTTIKHPSCPRCRSPDTGFCYYDGGATTRPNHFCRSCNKFFSPVAPFSVPLLSPAPSACSWTAPTHNAGIRGDVRSSKRWRRQQQKSRAGRPRLPCPGCGSSDTRFLKNLSKGHTMPRHFCFSCERCWVMGAALHGRKWGAAVAPPRCLRCDSPCTRSSGYCDAGRTKLLHREPSYGWISTDDEDDDGTVPAMESSSSSCSASASQPVEEASSPCGTSGGDASTRETAAGVAAAAAQDATGVDTKLPEAGFLDLDGNVLGGERELSWEDIELIDCALQSYLEEEFRAAFFPLEGR